MGKTMTMMLTMYFETGTSCFDNFLGKILKCDCDLEILDQNYKLKTKLRNSKLIISNLIFNNVDKSYELECYDLNDNKKQKEVISSEIFNSLATQNKYNDTFGGDMGIINISYEII
jgi:hypothetical protein